MDNLIKQMDKLKCLSSHNWQTFCNVTLVVFFPLMLLSVLNLMIRETIFNIIFFVFCICMLSIPVVNILNIELINNNIKDEILNLFIHKFKLYRHAYFTINISSKEPGKYNIEITTQKAFSGTILEKASELAENLSTQLLLKNPINVCVSYVD